MAEVAAWVAIGAGFATIPLQRWAAEVAAARAAGRLAKHSVEHLTERLAALIHADRTMEFALRGQRSSETIAVLRELDISTLPSKFIEPVAAIRSGVSAVNGRIDEVLKAEAKQPKRRDDRRKHLFSAGRVLVECRSELVRLGKLYRLPGRPTVTARGMDPDLVLFLSEADGVSRVP